jgi:hypothetical protein
LILFEECVSFFQICGIQCFCNNMAIISVIFHLLWYRTLLIELAQAWTFSLLSCQSFSISFISKSFSCFSLSYFASFPFIIIYLLSFLLFFYIFFDPLPSFPLFFTLIFAWQRFIVPCCWMKHGNILLSLFNHTCCYNL